MPIDRQNLYSVPFLYFDGLAGSVMHSINADAAGQPLSVSRPPYSSPAGYFDNLAQIIVEKAKASDISTEVYAELSHVAPLLATINRQMVYAVPGGYFEQFAAAVEKQIPQAAKTRVIHFSDFRKQLQYAVAAAIIGILAIAAFLFIPADKQVPLDSATSSAINIPAAMNKVGDEEIIDFLDNNSFGPEIIGANTILQDNIIDIEHIIKNTSEQEIKEYLKEYDEPAFDKAKDS